jgi:hypothetical protein
MMGYGRIPLQSLFRLQPGTPQRPPEPRTSFRRFLADPCHRAIRKIGGASLIPIGPTLPRERVGPGPCPPREAQQFHRTVRELGVADVVRS